MSDIYIPPRDVAKRLGVSASGLRRLAVLYEGIFGPLPRVADSRTWPLEAVERLEDARALVNRGRAKSIQDALLEPHIGDRAPSEALAPQPPGEPPQVEVLKLLVDEVREMRRELADLRQDNQLMRRQLEAPQPRRITIVPIDPRLEEAEQMNRYLLAELERRRFEAEAAEKPRRWWRLWGRI